MKKKELQMFPTGNQRVEVDSNVTLAQPPTENAWFSNSPRHRMNPTTTKKLNNPRHDIGNVCPPFGAVEPELWPSLSKTTPVKVGYGRYASLGVQFCDVVKPSTTARESMNKMCLTSAKSEVTPPCIRKKPSGCPEHREKIEDRVTSVPDVTRECIVVDNNNVRDNEDECHGTANGLARSERCKAQRERRKAKKQRLKEDMKRKEMLAPKSTKLHIVPQAVVDLMLGRRHTPRPSSSTTSITTAVDAKRTKAGQNSGGEKAIRFLDEEYPDLLTSTAQSSKAPNDKVRKILHREATDANGDLMSDAESASEWETENEDNRQAGPTSEDVNDEREVLVNDDGGVIKSILKPFSTSKTVSDQKGPLSYAERVKRGEKNATSVEVVTVTSTTASPVETTSSKQDVKRVKKKDPILVDLFDALMLKKNEKKETKKAKKSIKVVLGSKLSAQRRCGGRNMLDSTAPTKRRGKERVTPRKKRLTKMRKIILADRKKRKALRENLENRQHNLVQDETERCPPKSEEKVLSSQNVKETCSIQVDNSVVGTAFNSTAADLITDEEAMIKAKRMTHSRKFRPYCDHLLSKELDAHAVALLQDIVRFQDRKFAEDPMKAKARKRYVVGIREATKYCKVGKVVCLIMAPDIENVTSDGGLNDVLADLLSIARSGGSGEKARVAAPVFFVLNRYKLGRTLKRRTSVSCAAILNYQGSEQNFLKMTELLPNLKEGYLQKLKQALEEVDATVSNVPIVDPSSMENASLSKCLSNSVEKNVADKLIQILKS